MRKRDADDREKGQRTRRKRESSLYSPLCVYTNNTSTFYLIIFILSFGIAISHPFKAAQNQPNSKCLKMLQRKKDRILSAGLSLPFPDPLISPTATQFQIPEARTKPTRHSTRRLPVCLTGTCKVTIKWGLK